MQEQRREAGGGASPSPPSKASFARGGSLLAAEAELLARGSGGSGNFGNFVSEERGLASFTRRASVRRMAAETRFSARTFWLELLYHQCFPVSWLLMAWLEGGRPWLAVSNRLFVVPLRASRGGGPTAVIFCTLQLVCCLGMWTSWIMLILAYTAVKDTAFGRGVRPMTLDVCITNVLWLLRNLVVATKYAYVPQVEYDAMRKRLLTREEHTLRMMGGGWRDPLQSRQIARELMLAAMRRRVIARASAGGFRVSSAGEVWWSQQLARLRHGRSDSVHESLRDDSVRDGDGSGGDGDAPRLADGSGGDGEAGNGCFADADPPSFELPTTDDAPVDGEVSIMPQALPSLNRIACCERVLGRKAFAQELLETFPSDPGDGLEATFYVAASQWLDVGETELACAAGEQQVCAEADAHDALADGTSFVPTRVMAAWIVHRATGSDERRRQQLLAAERERSIVDGPGDPIGTPQVSKGIDWLWSAIWLNAALGSLISPLWRLTGLSTRSAGTWALSCVLYPMSFFGLLSSVLFVVVAGIDFSRRAKFSFLLNSLLVSGTVGGDPPEQPIVMTSRRRDMMSRMACRACCRKTAQLALSLEELEARLSVHWAYAESAQAWLAARQLLMDFGRMYISRIKLFVYFYAAYVLALVAVIFGALIADNNCCDNTDGYLITQVIYHAVLFLILLARAAFEAGNYNDINARQVRRRYFKSVQQTDKFPRARSPHWRRCAWRCGSACTARRCLRVNWRARRRAWTRSRLPPRRSARTIPSTRCAWSVLQAGTRSSPFWAPLLPRPQRLARSKFIVSVLATEAAGSGRLLLRGENTKRKPASRHRKSLSRSCWRSCWGSCWARRMSGARRSRARPSSPRCATR